MNDILTIARDYISWDPNIETRNIIQSLVDSGNENELKRLLSSRLSFGTAGLRGPMGAGYNCMNSLVILQTTQGLIRYLENVLGNNAKSQGVIIGYDHRLLGTLSSLEFARVSAAVFIGAGFKVYCLEDYVPTPFVAYGVTLLELLLVLWLLQVIILRWIMDSKYIGVMDLKLFHHMILK